MSGRVIDTGAAACRARRAIAGAGSADASLDADPGRAARRRLADHGVEGHQPHRAHLRRRPARGCSPRPRSCGSCPIRHARSLHTGRTSIVGALILDSKAQRFAMPLIIGADTALSEINLSMIACDAKGDLERARSLIEMLRARTVDGLIVIGEHQAVWPSLTPGVDRPIVYVHGETSDPNDTVFLPDDQGGDAPGRRSPRSPGPAATGLHVTGPRQSRAVQPAGHRPARGRAGPRSVELVAPVVYGPWSQLWARSARRGTAAHASRGRCHHLRLGSNGGRRGRRHCRIGPDHPRRRGAHRLRQLAGLRRGDAPDASPLST